MNIIEAVVTEVTGEPYEEYGCWWVPVLYASWGYPGVTNIMCATLEAAKLVVPGYVFMT